MFRARRHSYALLACLVLPGTALAVSNNAAVNLEVPDPPMQTDAALNGNFLANSTEFLTPDGIVDTLPEPVTSQIAIPEEALLPLQEQTAEVPMATDIQTAAQPETMPEAALQAVQEPEIQPEQTAQAFDPATIEPAAGPTPQPLTAAETIAATPAATVIPATPQYLPQTVEDQPQTSSQPELHPEFQQSAQPDTQIDFAPDASPEAPTGEPYASTNIDFLPDAPRAQPGTDYPAAAPAF